MKIHRSFMYGSPALRKIQIFFSGWMDNPSTVTPCRRPISATVSMSSWCTQQLGIISEILCCVKEASPKATYSVISFVWHSWKCRPAVIETRSTFARNRGWRRGVGLWRNTAREFGVMELLHILIVVVVTWIHTFLRFTVLHTQHTWRVDFIR